MKALLLENIHPEGVRLLTERGIDVELVKGALDEAELISALDGVQLLGIRSKTTVTAPVLDAAPDLMAIGAFCIGTNQIDLARASELGVAAFNSPFSNTRSVVELAIAEIIAMARHLTDKNALMHAGVWDKSAKGAHEVRGRTLGIVGYGNIGSQLSVIAEALGMRVYFYDVADKLALGNARRCATLDELLEVSETVSLHVDGRAGNAGLFGAEQFAKMRPRSLFLNLCRGIVVDHDALREHLLSGHIAGAALDVFAAEPKTAGDPFVSSLQGIPNVILTPHVGGSTEEAQQDIGRFVAGKLRDFAFGGNTTMSVNMPQVQTEESAGRSRVLHVHHNVPGVLATVNGVLANFGVNIEGQVLSTRGDARVRDHRHRQPVDPRTGRQAGEPARDGTPARPRLIRALANPVLTGRRAPDQSRQPARAAGIRLDLGQRPPADLGQFVGARRGLDAGRGVGDEGDRHLKIIFAGGEPFRSHVAQRHPGQIHTGLLDQLAPRRGLEDVGRRVVVLDMTADQPEASRGISDVCPADTEQPLRAAPDQHAGGHREPRPRRRRLSDCA